VPRNIVNLHRSGELAKLVDRVVREIEAHRSLDSLGLGHARKTGQERGDESVVKLKGRSHRSQYAISSGRFDQRAVVAHIRMA
jgi:hypothetical protein